MEVITNTWMSVPHDEETAALREGLLHMSLHYSNICLHYHTHEPALHTHT